MQTLLRRSFRGQSCSSSFFIWTRAFHDRRRHESFRGISIGSYKQQPHSYVALKYIGLGSMIYMMFAYHESLAEAKSPDVHSVEALAWDKTEPMAKVIEVAADADASKEESNVVMPEKPYHDGSVAFFKMLYRYFKLEWPWLSLCLVTSILSAGLSLYFPSATTALARWMVLKYTRANTATILSYRPLYRFLSCISLQAFLLFLNTVVTSKLCDRVTRRIRRDLYMSLLEQPLSFYDATGSTGALVHCLSVDASDFRHSIKQLLSSGLRHGILLTGNVVSLFAISPKLTLLLMTLLPVSFLIGNLHGVLLRSASKDYKSRESEATGRVNEVLGNMRLVLAFTGEQVEEQKYERALERVSQAGDRLAFHIGLFQSLVSLSIQSVTLVVLWMGASSLVASAAHMDRDMALATSPLTSYLIMSQQAQSSLAALSGLYAQALKAYSSGSRLFEWMTDATMGLNGQELNWDPFVHMEGRIKFENVDFAYPTRASQPVLKSLCFEIEKGKAVALCGRSGSGKSTIVALLERFYEPSSGVILIDQMPISLIDKKLLRRHIGYIPQEPVLFNDTIHNNIRYGTPEATPEQVVQAAEQAYAHEFIQALPEGYETRVGERGMALSGGQKQRIAIARAILKNPSILILDEATSALDNHSEHLVQSALDNVMQGRTVIVIAHRLSSLKSADRILLIDQGRIVEQGTHESLLKLGKGYAALYRLTEHGDQTIVDA